MWKKKKVDPKAYWQEPKAAKKRGEELIALLERNLDFRRWRFKVSYTNFTQVGGPKVIYNSEWCRVKFSLSYEMGRRFDELLLLYGRLHAPDEGVTMLWNGEECLCWHNLRWSPILFLDGLSPEEAAHFKGKPPLVEQFWQSEEGKKLYWTYHPEFRLRIESILWEHYGQRLFELFDLRRSELWGQYVRFNREYYKILNRKSIPGFPFPPEDKIC